MVAEQPESNERNAAGIGGVFSLLSGLAAGGAMAGLIELTRTLSAFGTLQFIPTDATEKMFVNWTWAMLASPAAVIASSILLAVVLASARTRTAFVAGVLGLTATLWLAARVWENVTGYLTPADGGPPLYTAPLPPQRWPMVYQHGIAVLVSAVVLTLMALAYALWRTRPRPLPFFAGLLVAVGIVMAGGQFGFAAVAFLRLRNLSVAVAVLDAVAFSAVLLRRRFDVILLIALMIVAVSAWQLDRSWRGMLPEMPHGIGFPQW